jgi:hypothetical protein
MKIFYRNFKIVDEKDFEQNAYATFCIALADLCYKDKKQFKILDIRERKLNIQDEETKEMIPTLRYEADIIVMEPNEIKTKQNGKYKLDKNPVRVDKKSPEKNVVKRVVNGKVIEEVVKNA